MIPAADARWRLHYHLAKLLVRFRRYDAAANAYARALRLQPGNPDLQFHRAWCLLHVPDRRRESIAAFETLLAAAPSAFGYHLMAWGLQHEDRHEEAIRAFDESERLEPPSTAEFYLHRATSLATLWRLEEAAEAYERAAHFDPSNDEPWGLLGSVLAHLGRWKEAAPCQERAMRLAPGIEHGLNLATTLHELDRLDDAERVLRQCLVIDPHSSDVRERLAAVLAGCDRYDEALALARALCAVAPVPVSSRTVLAGVLMEAGRLQEALQEARAACDAAAADPRPQLVLGAIHVRLGNGDAALAAFERFEAITSKSTPRPSVFERLWSAVGRGDALSVLGRHEAAMIAFEEALRLDPEFFVRWPDVASYYARSSAEIERRRREG